MPTAAMTEWRCLQDAHIRHAVTFIDSKIDRSGRAFLSSLRLFKAQTYQDS